MEKSREAPTSERLDASCFGLAFPSSDSPASKPSSVTNYKYDPGQSTELPCTSVSLTERNDSLPPRADIRISEIRQVNTKHSIT